MVLGVKSKGGVHKTLGRLVDETEKLNMDRKQAVLTGLSWLSA